MDYKLENADMDEVWQKTMDLLNLVSMKLDEKEKQKEWMNSREAAELLMVTRRTLQNYRTNGMVKFSRLGGKIYYKRSDLQDLLNGSGRAA